MAPPSASPTAAARWEIVSGRRMYARTWPASGGGSPAVVLVHGFVVSGAYFVPTAERLAGALPVYAPDLPGFGRSDHPDEALTVPGLAGALIEWMAAMGLGQAVLVANSFGCQVVVELAMRRPDVVERLVLSSPTMDPTARTVIGQLVRWRKESRAHSVELTKLLLGDYVAAGVGRIVRTFRHALADRIEDKLPFVAAPTLVVRGTADPIVSQAWAEEVARLLPRGRLTVLCDVPHAMNFDAPDPFVTVMRPFLALAADPRSEE